MKRNSESGYYMIGITFRAVVATPGFPLAAVKAGGAAKLGANFDTSHFASEYCPASFECRRNSAAGAYSRARSANPIAPARCIHRSICVKSWHAHFTLPSISRPCAISFIRRVLLRQSLGAEVFTRINRRIVKTTPQITLFWSTPHAIA
jgi:hypothetical protein